MKFPQFLTVKEVADTLKMNPLTVYDYIRNKKLPALKFGRYYRVSVSDFEAFLKLQKVT